VADHVPHLRTAGVIAEELGVPLARVLYVLRKRSETIRPIGRAGTLRLYSHQATAIIREEISAIDARRDRQRCRP
jgi:hypothetical protein